MLWTSLLSCCAVSAALSAAARLVAASEAAVPAADSAAVAALYCATWVLPSCLMAVWRSAISCRFSAIGASDHSIDSVPSTVGMPSW